MSQAIGDTDEEELPKFSIEFEPIEETLKPPFTDHFVGYTTPAFNGGLVRSNPGGFVLIPELVHHAEKLYRFRPRENDIWIVTFPKCGTTWTQEMVWLLVNDCDIDAAKKTPLHLRSPFLEMPYMVPKEKANSLAADKSTMTIEMLDEIPKSQKRVIKTHLPFQMLNPQLIDTCKVVYVVRNPKDVIVSFYYHHTLFQKFYQYNGDLDQFARYFINDLVIRTPYFAHILEAWNHRHHPNLLFLFYEDLKKDLRGQITKIAEFLNRPPLSAEELDKMTQHLSFTNFSKNPMVNLEMSRESDVFKDDGRFIRNGKTGDWKNYFSSELNEEIDRWIKDQLGDSELKFDFELEHQD